MDYLERCGICGGQFRMPRGLPCLHSFCEDCLDGRIAGQLSCVEAGKTFSCPTCGKAHVLPVNLVQGYPVDVKVPNIEYMSDGPDLYCDKHPTKPKTWYCQASGCKITTCSVCYKLFHEGHVIESHDKNIRKLKLEAREALEENENRIQFYREKMDLLESSKDEIDAHTHKTVRYIKSRVDYIMRRVNRAAEKMVKNVVAHNKTQKKAIQESISDLYRLTENYSELCSDLDRLESKGSNSDFLRSGSMERVERFTENVNIEKEIPESWEKMVLQLSKVHSDDDVFARLMIGDFAYDTVGVDFEYMNHGVLDVHRGPLQFEMDEDTSRSGSFHDIAVLDDVDSGLSLRVAKGLKMKSVARMSELDRSHHAMAAQSPDFGMSPPRSFPPRNEIHQDVPVVCSAASPWNAGFKEPLGSPRVSSNGKPISQAPISITEPKTVVGPEMEPSKMNFYLGTPPQAEPLDTLTTITSPNRSESLLKKSSSHVKIIHQKTLKTEFHGHRLATCVDRKGHMIWSGCSGDGWTLQERDQSGSILWEKKPKDWTRIMPASLTMVTQGDTQFIAVAFTHLKQITLIKPESDKEILAYEHVNQEPHKIEWLPPNKMLVLDRSKFPVVLHVLDCSVLPWRHIQIIDTGLNFARAFTSVETPEGVYAVVTSLDDFSIRAFHLESSTMVWELLGQVDGHLLLPGGLTADSQGHIYITDTNNRRLLVVNIAGHVIQTLSTAARPTSVYAIPSDNRLLVKYAADGTWVVSVWDVEAE